MARVNEAAALLKQGRNLREIRADFGITLHSVMGYLYTAVGEGQVRRSDILFAIPSEERQSIESLIEEVGTTAFGVLRYEVQTERLPVPIDIDVLGIYLGLRDLRVQMGDMYEFIAEIEKTLHTALKQVWIGEYGPTEDGWWRQGIPQAIRKTCAALREDDPDPAKEPDCYANFIHLQEILDKQWNLFSQVLPRHLARDKKTFPGSFTRLNQIRNSVMHPVKARPLTENDFGFVREFNERTKPEKWRGLDELGKAQE